MKSIIIVGSLFILFPNIFNKKERNAFSDEKRIAYAMENFHIDRISDSVVVPAGIYYDRKGFHKIFYGSKYRELWIEPVKVKVLHLDTLMGGLKGVELGGGMQTIGLDLLSSNKREYDLRSVNKDQSMALPKWLRITYARTMFRDQTIALNPYGALVVPTLANAAGFLHSNPQLLFVPYDPAMKQEFRKKMAGRMVILEENVNKTWMGSNQFGSATGFYDTGEMFEKAEQENIPIDTVEFLKCRLLDIMISDWDRHEGQWEWALIEEKNKIKFRPVPKDRDMAFSKFNGGFISSVTLIFNKKFQTFTDEYKNVSALTYNGREMDKKILSNIDRSLFLSIANNLQKEISDSVIEAAFKNYPPEIYTLTGEEHIQILKARRNKLTEAAKAYYQRIQ